MFANLNPKLLRLWQAQQGKCPLCRQQITQESRWHCHHIVWRTLGGGNQLSNLHLLHPACAENPEELAEFDNMISTLAEAWINKLFDPFYGPIDDLDLHVIATLRGWDDSIKDAYEERGINLEEAAQKPGENPMDLKKLSNDVGADLVFNRIIDNSQHQPFILFLQELGLPTDYCVNKVMPHLSFRPEGEIC